MRTVSVRSSHVVFRLFVTLLSVGFAIGLNRTSIADNAAFALAPRNATIAVDARGFADVLGSSDTAVRSLLGALAGEQALATFDAVARRGRGDAETTAREVFAGSVAFYAIDGGRETSQWMFGVEADDARCQRVLRMLGARMDAPGRFTSMSEKLLLRRVGGWLLMSPIALGESALDEAARRVVKEDPAGSLLGEPLMQAFLGSDAPVRIFLRHGAPIGGATTLGISRNATGLRAELNGNYDDSPLGAAIQSAPLDERLVRALSNDAAFVLVSPTDGLPDPSDTFWIALVPELSASPAMRSNLSGERLLAVGRASVAVSPAIALAWRVDDASQAESEQDLFMHGVCCGMARAIEVAPGSRESNAKGGDSSHATGLSTATTASSSAESVAPKATTDREQGAGRRCDALGGFADRYLGSGFKLGRSVLCWSTVSTDCGGWQVYASDPSWLRVVEGRLQAHACAGAEQPRAAGLGLCDGPEAARLLRTWKPLVEGDGAGVERLTRGLEAVAAALESLGRVTFRYETPNSRSVHAVLELRQSAARDAGAAR